MMADGGHLLDIAATQHQYTVPEPFIPTLLQTAPSRYATELQVTTSGGSYVVHPLKPDVPHAATFIYLETCMHTRIVTQKHIYIYMGGCQNYGPFSGTLNIRGRIIIGIQKGPIILTTTHMSIVHEP